MSDDPYGNRPSRDWPTEVWILLAVAPGLLSDLLAFVLAGTRGAGESVLMSSLFLIPLLTIPYLIMLSGPYLEARRPGQSGGRLAFVLSFCAINAFLWGGSCVIVLSHMSFH